MDLLTAETSSAIINLMVNYSRSLDQSFGALSHPIRRAVLARLAAGEATVAELARPHRVSAPAISKHLRILEEAGLVSRRKQGREHHCRLEAERLKDAVGWIEDQRKIWNERLDRLERYLKENP